MPDRPDRLAGESMRHYTRPPMPDRTCATCQHWDQHDDLPAGICERIKDYDGDHPWPPEPEVRSIEGDGYLWVAADFGCTLHQPTTEETP